MAETKTYNKIIYTGNVLIDLTADTVTPSVLHSGITAHDASGAIITGTNTFDADTSEDTAGAAEILSGKTAHAKGAKVTGSMPNRGGVTGSIATKAGVYTIPAGYHDGSGKVSISSTEQTKLIASNIRSGVQILGVTGTMSGTEAVKAQAPTVTPKATAQTVTPASGYNYLSQVTVQAIPYTEIANDFGGYTVTIG